MLEFPYSLVMLLSNVSHCIATSMFMASSTLCKIRIKIVALDIEISIDEFVSA